MLLPVALLVTLALAVATAGLGGLGSLSQLVSGPQLDSAYLGSGEPAGSARRADAGPTLPRIPAAPIAAARAGGRGLTSTTAPAGVTRPAGRPVRGGNRRPTPRSGGGRSSPGSGPVPTPAVRPPVQSGTGDGAVRQLGGALQNTLRPIAGQTVAGTVGRLVDLVAPKGRGL